MQDFRSFNLLPALLNSLDSKGYQNPTPIQLKAIPHLLQGRDLLGIAQTGTGKTAAFSLPILHRLVENRVKTAPRKVRALILTPTRELASQIDENICAYGQDLGLSSTVIFGGVGHKPQIKAMAQGSDIVVATPGRLLDLINDNHILFNQLEFFVLDEADRMLDMGFIRDIKKIIAKLPTARQTLLFSATMPNDIAALANSLLKDPVRVQVTPESSTVEKIAQTVHYVETAYKPMLLKRILSDVSIKSVLVFARTKHGADRVVKQLAKDGITSAAIHGNKSQNARENALNSFRAGTLRVLVATDIAARGIDVAQISHVINYNLPDDPKSYVHRIGRTARAGRNGVAISFCDEAEMKLLRDIEKTIKFRVPVDKNHPYHKEHPQIAPTPSVNIRRRRYR